MMQAVAGLFSERFNQVFQRLYGLVKSYQPSHGRTYDTLSARSSSQYFRNTSLLAMLALMGGLLISPSSHAATGAEWLATQTQTDGSYANLSDVSTANQSTSEVLRAFSVLGETTQPGIGAAVQFIDAETFLSVENLSRKIITYAEQGLPAAILLNDLNSRQNLDGGFGDLPGYDSTSLDTAFALKALGVVGNSDPGVVSGAISFLLNNQNIDGSFSVNAVNESSVYVTALSVSALQHFFLTYNLGTSLESAKSFLIGQQIIGGGWESDWETALSLLAIVPTTTDASLYTGAATTLGNNQLLDGSWSGDVYTTALALRALALVANVQIPTNPSKGQLVGVVLDDTTGLPIANATIVLDEAPTFTTTTQSLGQFSLSDVDAGQYTIRYQATGYIDVTQTVAVQAGEIVNRGPIRLAPQLNIGVVTGIITDTNTGLPITGATIDIVGVPTATISTDVSGLYRTASPAGQLDITVSAIGYDTVNASAVITAGTTLNFSPSLYAIGTTPTDPTVTLRGTLVDIENSSALVGAAINVLGTAFGAVTDINGDFEITGLNAGQHTLELSQIAYQTASVTIAAPATSVINLGTVALSKIAIPTVTTLIGTITDAVTGAAIPNANIFVEPLSFGVQSGVDGSFRIENISITQFSVAASAVGYISSITGVNLTQAGTAQINFALQRVVASGIDILQVSAIEPSYPALSKVELNTVIENTNASPMSVRLYLKAIDASGKVVDQYPARLIPKGTDPNEALEVIAANVQQPTVATWNTKRHAPGVYQVVVQAYEGFTGQLLAERSTQVQVDSTKRIGGMAEFDPPIAQLAAKQPVAITGRIANQGNEIIGATTITAKVSLRNPGYQSRKDLVEVSTFVNDSKFTKVNNLDIDSAGNIYVVNGTDNTVIKVAPDGTRSVFDDALSRPVDVDIDVLGNIYVLNNGGSFVRFGIDGSRTEIQTGIVSQKALEALPDGRVLITKADTLYEVSITGAVRSVVSGVLASPHGAVVNSAGTVYFASTGTNSISAFENGELSTFVSGINQPYGVAVDSLDNLYVTSFSDNALYKITPVGDISTVATGLSGPYDVTIAPNGNFIVSNLNSHQILSITPAGVVDILAESPIYRPYSAAYDALGNLYVGNKQSDKVVKFGVDGSHGVVATGVFNTQEIVVSSDGSLDLLGNNQVTRVLPDGTKFTVASSLTSATAMAKAFDGNGLLVAQGGAINKLVRVDALGAISDYMIPQFSSPTSTQKGLAGEFYVINSGSYIGLTKVEANGQITRMAPLNDPRGVSIDGAGNLFITEYRAQQVITIDQAGSASVVADLPFRPGGIAVSATGDLFVSAYGTSTIHKIDAVGISEFAVLDYSVLDDFVIDDSGALWVPHRNSLRVTRIAADGTRSVYVTANHPRSIQPDGQDGAFVATRGKIQHIDGLGVVTDVIADTWLVNKILVGVVDDDQGRFWVSDSTGVLYRFDSDFSQNVRFSTLDRPTGLRFSNNGQLIVINGNGKILRIANANILPEVLADGSFEKLVNETAQTMLVSNAASVKRLDLTTGDISNVSSGFSDIEALAVAPDGGVVVGDALRNELTFFDATGIEQRRVYGLVSPKGLLFDANGDLLVTNLLPRSIMRLRQDKAFEKFANLGDVESMFLEPSGNILAVGNAGLQELSPGGDSLNTYPFADTGVGLVRDAAGNLIVAGKFGSVYEFSADWNYSQVASGIGGLRDIESDSSGNLYVSDSNKSIVQVVGTDGTLQLKYADIPGVTALAFSSNDTLFVGTQSVDKIVSFHPDGVRSDAALQGIFMGGVLGMTVANENEVYVGASDNNIVKLLFSEYQPDVLQGDLVYTSTVSVTGLSLIGDAIDVDFGEWTPTVSGDYIVEISSDDPSITGFASNTLHVGPQAEGELLLSVNQAFPGDRAVSANLNVSGADSTNITMIDAAGTSLAAITGTGGIRFGRHSRGVVADTLGNIFVVDFDRIVKTTPAGVVSDFVTGVNITGYGLAIDSNDNIYGTNVRDIIRVTPQGEISTYYTHADPINGITISHDDEMFVVTDAQIQGQLLRINPDGTTTIISTNTPRSALGLSVDIYGNFYTQGFKGAVTEDYAYKIAPDGSSSIILGAGTDRFDFEREGVNLTADCSNNVLFAPVSMTPFVPDNWEENKLLHLVGDTGEVRVVLDGPTLDPDLGDMDLLYYDRFSNRLLIWTDLNSGKVFSFPVVCGGIDTEVHLITRADVDLSSTNPAPTSVVDLGNGTQEYAWSLTDVDVTGENIQLNLLFKGLINNETRPALSDAFLVFNNSFMPGESIQVPITIPGLSATMPLAVQPVTDAAEYGPNTIVNIMTDVSNQSDVVFDGALDIAILDEAGNLVTNLPSIAVSNLAALGNQLLNSQWNVGNTYAGNYKVIATLRDAAGSEMTTGESTFAVVAGAVDPAVAVLDATVTTDRATYDAWDTVTVNARLRNNATNTFLPSSTVSVVVTAPDGSTVFTGSSAAPALLPNGLVDIPFQFGVIDGVAGQYAVQLNVIEAASGAPMANSQVAFGVIREDIQSLQGNVTVSSNQVLIGETPTCTDTITNVSASTVTGATVIYSLFNMDTGATVTETSVVTDIAANDAIPNNRIIDTAGYAPGGYACALRATAGGVTGTLGYASFQVMNQKPIANAGIDQMGGLSSLFVLNGTASNDADGHALTYAWTLIQQPVGSVTSLAANNIASTSFVPDVRGDYVVQLVVNDGFENSAPVQVTITVTNRAPVANAGADQIVHIGDAALLDSTGSVDADGDTLTYQWTVLSMPTGSSSVLSNGTAANPGINIDSHGSYVLQLVVNDGSINSVSDTVTLTVENVVPVADAGPDQLLNIGDVATLMGIMSTDADGDALTYQWNIVSALVGSTSTLSDATALSPTLAIDAHGSYTVELIVNDGFVDSLPATVTLMVANRLPVAVTGPNQTTYVGQTIGLTGAGSFDDDGDAITYSWTIMSSPVGSTAMLTDTTAVSPTIVVDRKGDYVIDLIVNDGLDNSLPTTVTISVTNTPPLANAGPDQLIHIGDVVTLDGSASTDADGNALTYSWSIVTQPAGSVATLSDPMAVMPTITIDALGEYVFELTVNDGQLDSVVDQVILNAVNVAPVANAGPDQSVSVGQIVQLDGTTSSDVDGDPITYVWSIVSAPVGSVNTLSDASIAQPTLVIDVFGTYTLQLIVNDGVVDSAADTVILNVVNTPPVANAGPDQGVFVGSNAILDGGASSDADGDLLTYSWSLIEQPVGSTAVLVDTTTANPSIVIDEQGVYVAQLIVHDGIVDSIPDTVVLNVANVRPIANAGIDQSVTTPATVTLDGTGSSDADGDSLAYTWSISSAPAGSLAVISDPTTVNPTIDADLAGDYVIQLIVNDGLINSNPDTVLITGDAVCLQDMMGNGNNGRVDLYWTPEANVDHYRIYRNYVGESSPYGMVDNYHHGSMSSYSDYSVSNGTTYYYRVEAVKNDATVCHSPTVSATPEGGGMGGGGMGGGGGHH